jgi:hypothetical protein
MIGALTVLGGLAAAGTFFAFGPQRFWANWLVWMLLLLSAGLGALFLTALEHLTGARWSVPLRRSAERVSGLLVPACAAAALALFSLPVLYPWAGPEAAQHPLIAAKAGWLNVPFFAARVAVCAGLWLVFWRVFAGGSLKQDRSRDPALSERARRFAPFFMVVMGLTTLVVSFDWISSLEPEWYSDVIGVYLFAGSFLAGLAAVTLTVGHLKERGRLSELRFDHVYSLGAWLFAFTVFWSYIAFAQYLLMWYADLPEEVFWYAQRGQGAWRGVSLALGLFHFIIPFFALLPRDAKGDLRRLRWVAALVLGAHFLDLYWLVFPVLGARPLFSWPELGFAAFFIGVSLLWMRRALRQGADMPVGDPGLAEGLAFKL